MNLWQGYLTFPGLVFLVHVYGLPRGVFSRTSTKCGTLGQPPSNGRYNATSGSYGDVARLICNHGYDIQGQGQRTCGAGGRWSLLSGSCQVIHCGPLDKPSHGQYNPTSDRYQAQSTLICDIGYQTQALVTRTCQADGTWSLPVGTCQVINCDPLVNPSHGHYNPTPGWYMYHTQSTLICDSGYQTQTTVTRTCQADRTWSLPEGTCQAKQCGTLGQPPSNGRYNATSGNYGDVVTVICNHGYVLQGSGQRTCGGNGTWPSSLGRCQAKTCERLRNSDHGNYTKGVETLSSYKDVTQFTCEPGYVIIVNGTQVDFHNRTCQSNKTWSGSEAECQVKQCGLLTNPFHGQYNPTSDRYQAQSTLICDKGFQTQTPVTRTCQANGTWSLPVGTCQDSSISLGKDSETYPWTVLLVGVGIGVALSLLSALIIFASKAYTRRRKTKSSANELYTIPTATREDTTYYDELGRPDSFNGGNSMEEANQYEITDP